MTHERIIRVIYEYEPEDSESLLFESEEEYNKFCEENEFEEIEPW